MWENLIERDYFEWLCERINANKDYSRLMTELYSTPYKPAFTMDENRTYGGLNLRDYFAYERGIWSDEVNFVRPCSVLEVLTALADSIAELMGDDSGKWFWEMMENMNLSRFSDNSYSAQRVEEIIDNWLNRQYESDGSGSPFPLKKYRGDARNLTLWDQMNGYLNEKYPLGNWIQ